MRLDDLQQYCLAKKGVTEEFPFDEEILVYKVMGKAFVLTGITEFNQFNVKCDPDKAIELRERYACVQPGYHMNKKHWNTILIDGSVTKKQLQEWIDDSYNLVVAGLPKKLREELG